MDQQIIEMDRGTFAEWAEQTFGVSYDNVSLWDMMRDLNSSARMPEGFEVSSDGDIPAALYDILVARKTHRAPAYAARDAAKGQSEQEARALVAQPEPWSRETWKRLVTLGYATRFVEDGGEQGHMSASYALTERGERLLDPSYRAPGMYADQVEP